MIDRLKRQLRSLNHAQRQVLAVIVIFSFAFLGVLFIDASRAAGPFISKEAEAGTISAPAQSVNDTAASGSSAIKFAGTTTPPPPPPPSGLTNVPYGTDPAQILDIVKPATGTNRPAIVMIHGGGWVMGDKQMFTRMAEDWSADVGAVVFNINYRLIPDGKYPNATNDVRSAVAWIRTNASFYGVDPNRIGTFGNSAGGHLAGYLIDQPGVKAMAGWSGLYDWPLTITDPLRGAGDNGEQLQMTDFVGCSYSVCPSTWADVSPVNHMNKNVALHLVHSQGEFIPLSQMYSLRDKQKALGGYVESFEVAGNNHGNKIKTQPLLNDGRLGQAAVTDFWQARL